MPLIFFPHLIEPRRMTLVPPHGEIAVLDPAECYEDVGDQESGGSAQEVQESVVPIEYAGVEQRDHAKDDGTVEAHLAFQNRFDIRQLLISSPRDEFGDMVCNPRPHCHPVVNRLRIREPETNDRDKRENKAECANLCETEHVRLRVIGCLSARQYYAIHFMNSQFLPDF